MSKLGFLYVRREDDRPIFSTYKCAGSDVAFGGNEDAWLDYHIYEEKGEDVSLHLFPDDEYHRAASDLIWSGVRGKKILLDSRMYDDDGGLEEFQAALDDVIDRLEIEDFW